MSIETCSAADTATVLAGLRLLQQYQAGRVHTKDASLDAIIDDILAEAGAEDDVDERIDDIAERLNTEGLSYGAIA